MLIDKKQIEHAQKVHLKDVPEHNAPPVKGLLEQARIEGRSPHQSWRDVQIARYGRAFERKRS